MSLLINIRLLGNYFHSCFVTLCLEGEWDTLIPKKNRLVSPISIFPILNMYIFTLIVTRWRMVLQEIISPEQAAFVGGRDVANSFFFLVQEIWSYIGSRHITRSSIILLGWTWKNSMSFNLGFSGYCIMKVGLWRTLVRLNLACATQFTLYLKWQGHYSTWITPMNGLRQRDPLASILFILATESLTIIIRHARVQKQINAFKISNLEVLTTYTLFWWHIIFGQ